MKIVIAPQAFKGSLEAPEVTDAIARGVKQVWPHAELVLLPVADGGEGTVRALVQSSGGETVATEVLGPLEKPVNAVWGILGDGETAVIEMAAASGLPLLRRDERNPWRATSYGTGQLIREVVARGLRRLIIGIGGSATNDGGAGMAVALGARLLDKNGSDLPLGAGALPSLDRIDHTQLDSRLAGLHVLVACDVNNPLTGETGASHVYGPQKGADQHMVANLDAALSHYADVLERDLGMEVRNVPGSGAAGGLGAGLLAFARATLRPGVDIVFEALDLDSRLLGADLVITGEGRMDSQDIYGKAPLAVAQHAKRLGVPSLAVVGSTGRDYRIVFDHGLDAVIGTVNRPMTLDRAVSESSRLITEAAMRACRLIRIGQRMNESRQPRGSDDGPGIG